MQKFLCSEQKTYTCHLFASNLLIMTEAYYNYKNEDIVMLTDDSTNPRMMPTRENMVRCLYICIFCCIDQFYPY